MLEHTSFDVCDTDSYNPSHMFMSPPGLQEISMYLEPRTGSNGYQNVVVAGLQGLLLENYTKPVSEEMVDEFRDLMVPHGEPFDVRLYNLVGNKLPLEIQALPEGSVVPRGTPLLQYRSTDESLPDIATLIEAQLMRVWYPTTVASKALYLREGIRERLMHTQASDAGLEYMVHDFGARGCEHPAAAARGSAAHQLVFKGTDTVKGLQYVRRYYGTDLPADYMPSFSVPATAHSRTMLWGRDREMAFYQHVLNTFLKPNKIVSIVLDTYNPDAALKAFGTTFRNQIMNSGGRVVIRLDSGDPKTSVLTALHRLEGYYGFRVTQNKFKVLPDCIRILQADGVSDASIMEILDAMIEKNYCVSNIVFGMGGELLQNINRDTLRIAIKANNCIVNGVSMDIQKTPLTDMSKASKLSRQAVYFTNAHGYRSVHEAELPEGATNLLRKTFLNGDMLIVDNFEQNRARLNEHAIRLRG